mgnify:CR=1 FL=1
MLIQHNVEIFLIVKAVTETEEWHFLEFSISFVVIVDSKMQIVNYLKSLYYLHPNHSMGPRTKDKSDESQTAGCENDVTEIQEYRIITVKE